MVNIGYGPMGGDLFKLLGTLFGLDIRTRDVDDFLYHKIFKEV